MLTKMDAAREQLETAICLFFNNAPASAIHTLAAASLALSRDPLHNRGDTYTLDIEKWVRPDKKKEWRKIANAQANFLKHADKDPAAVLSFNEEQTKYQLLESVDAYHSLHAEITLPMKIYQIWFAHSYPTFFRGPGWGEMQHMLEEAGFGADCFTKEACGDLLLLVAAQQHTEFGSRCRRLFECTESSET